MMESGDISGGTLNIIRSQTYDRTIKMQEVQSRMVRKKSQHKIRSLSAMYHEMLGEGRWKTFSEELLSFDFGSGILKSDT